MLRASLARLNDSIVALILIISDLGPKDLLDSRVE